MEKQYKTHGCHVILCHILENQQGRSFIMWNTDVVWFKHQKMLVLCCKRTGALGKLSRDFTSSRETSSIERHRSISVL